MDRQPPTDPDVKHLLRVVWWERIGFTLLFGGVAVALCLVGALLIIPGRGGLVLTLGIIFFLSLMLVVGGGKLMQWAEYEVLCCGVGPPRAIGPMILAMENVHPRNKGLVRAFKETIQHLVWHLKPADYQALEDQHFQRLPNILDEQIVGALRMAKEHQDVIPPWILGGGIPPWSGGWRQGGGEAWFHSIWLPFWKGLSEDERVAFVDRWDAPSEWREYALSERWFH